MNYHATDELPLSVMANNLFDETPEDQASNFPGTSDTPYNNYYYNPYGRAVYLQAKYSFN